MKISEAYICLDCDEVYVAHAETDVNGKKIRTTYQCPPCTGPGYPLSRWLPGMNAERKVA